ncbi:hypothetical protein [Haloarcula marismortui]|uniref:hypothetical protein n=1 Tax=Haloarcula marismortui TaxID=2238 RepID=UPI0013779C08|nr:hypothetical protein [Haloarcula californiae]
MRTHEGSDTTVRARAIRARYDVIHNRAVTGALFPRWRQGHLHERAMLGIANWVEWDTDDVGGRYYEHALAVNPTLCIETISETVGHMGIFKEVQQRLDRSH